LKSLKIYEKTVLAKALISLNSCAICAPTPLRDALDREGTVDVTDAEGSSVYADHADAEQAGRHAGQRAGM
jgi:hypothetical protein